MTDRRAALLDIYRGYTRHPAFARLRAPGWPVVPGRGGLNPRYVFVGEAPGQAEQAARKPFVGPSGDVMARLLTHVGIDRREVFITNVVKYRPVQGSISVRNRTPTLAEQLASRAFLMRELDVFGSTPVITFGAIALAALALTDWKVSTFHGRGWYDAYRGYGCMYHPATVVYDPAMFDTLAADLERLVGGMQ